MSGLRSYKYANQTVFGEGNKRPRVMFIGEQPGDVEDKTGHVFVGPAGKLLDKALAAAGIKREDAYFTNAVKHFKYEWRGKRRIHAKPRRIEVVACRPWLEAEINRLMTVHPSSILRARDDESRHEQMQLFIDDLKKVAEALGQ